MSSADDRDIRTLVPGRPAQPGPPAPGVPTPRDDAGDTSPADDDYSHLIEDYSHLAPPAEGEILQGHVLKVTAQEVIIDFGYKSEGLLPIEEVRNPDGTVTLAPGDVIDVMVERGAFLGTEGSGQFLARRLPDTRLKHAH